jgi:hypothetical protein
MDPCVPGVSIENARAHARVKLGVPAKYANKMSVSSICKVSKMSSKTKILPPMEYRQYKGKMYLIDPKSPLSIRDFILLLTTGKTDDIKRIANEMGLLTDSISKSEIKSNIIKLLKVLNISEPIEIPTRKPRTAPLPVMNSNVNKMYGNNGSGNNGSGNNGSGNNGSGNNGSGNNGSGNNGSGNNGELGPESGETPYNEEVAPHLHLTARPSKVHLQRNSGNSGWSNNNRWPSLPSKTVQNVQPSKVSLEPITEERIRQDMILAEKLRKNLGGN